ncbi:hypothetical protein HAP48_0003970 [Bradyrhizobium septentrionale]|uniref:Uncharacterized protein n=1 Tax=Bradyrhizobium septentrionale TaxID=1404411 RepID=A0A973W6F8_9BRAD|nr:hypothetical protein [Bradyrhizobium septentrionale]UGY16718.1 hypothetical protein HAP48_0003970 [Bradyrhizobium septentrionale]
MADLITDLVADDLDAQILTHRMAGISVRAIMRRYGMTKREVEAALDRALPQINNATRIATIKLELERLDQLIRPFFVKALAGDTAAASILVKLSERRSSLLGACLDSRCSNLVGSDSTLGDEQVFSALEHRSDAASAAECAGLRAERPCLAVYG